MSPTPDHASSRRHFIGRVGQLGAAAMVAGCATGQQSHTTIPPRASSSGAGRWDLSWVDRVSAATDRAVFDSANINGGIAFDLATRYLDNCDAVYGVGAHHACVVLNVRTRAVPLALNDATWDRYALGAEYEVTDPVTKQPARRNPFMTQPPEASPGTGAITPLISRGAIMLACDFALGHLATRLAAKTGATAADVHRDLRAGFVAGAIAVPSGLFGLAKAQNAGCAYLLG